MTNSYFVRTGPNDFTGTEFTGGGWNPAEQHVAPGFGLIAHVLQQDFAERRGDDPLQMSRVSFDIYGVYAVGPVSVETRVLRPGRTIELVEATLSAGGRAAIVARAWFTARFDTDSLTDVNLPTIPPRTDMPTWDITEEWDGKFLTTVDSHRMVRSAGHSERSGKGVMAWLRAGLPVVAGEEQSTTTTLFSILDTTNGIGVLASPSEVAFPNLDLTVHLIREPAPDVDGWFGFDTSVSFGPTGLGLTQSVVQDECGPVAVSSQGLTVRPKM
ncbi:thioesterase family protein [Corynebacterium sputi]|uniref:thioesterase family protein n=1 Tax=Corynebacterium sputi TaxID=489915 RepID=UPI00047D16B5|nr:thioesterase family protein [Corynebacterium sputi]